MKAASQAQGSGNTAKTFKGYALTELTAAGLLYNPQAKAADHKALGPLSKEPAVSPAKSAAASWSTGRASLR